jgi:hypothetical protein
VSQLPLGHGSMKFEVKKSWKSASEDLMCDLKTLFVL